jgi:hypothetical protein
VIAKQKNCSYRCAVDAVFRCQVSGFRESYVRRTQRRERGRRREDFGEEGNSHEKSRRVAKREKRRAET